MKKKKQIDITGDKQMAQSQYEIIQELYRFPDVPGSEYHKELNIISWYGKQPCYDLRSWKGNHEKVGKGICLTEDELRELISITEDLLF